MQPRLHRGAPAQLRRPCCRARPSARTLFRRCRWEVELELQAVDTDGVRDALDAHSAAILVSEAVHLAGHQDDAVARQHLARRARARRASPRGSARRRGSRPLPPPLLPPRARSPPASAATGPPGSRRRSVAAGRPTREAPGGESRTRKAPRHRAARLSFRRRRRRPSRQLGEAGRQPRSLLVSSLARERRVPADVRDQKGANSRRAGYIVQLSQVAILVRGASRVSFRVRLG